MSTPVRSKTIELHHGGPSPIGEGLLTLCGIQVPEALNIPPREAIAQGYTLDRCASCASMKRLETDTWGT